MKITTVKDNLGFDQKEFSFSLIELIKMVREARQKAAAEGVLAPGQATFISHPDRGHSLGVETLMGPIDEAIADQIADEAAAGCAGATA